MAYSNTPITRTGPVYITKAVHLLANGEKKIVTSRRHRKGRGPKFVSPAGTLQQPKKHRRPWLCFWAPARLTWWVAVLFTIGSALFSLGGYFITFPEGKNYDSRIFL